MIRHSPRLLPGLYRRLELSLYSVLEGDRQWGRVRWYLGIALMVGFILLGRVAEHVPPNPALDRLLAGSFAALPSLPQSWQEPTLQAAQFLYSLFLPQTLRHALPAVVAFVLALRLGANYVRDLFELPAEGNTAARYMMGAVFGKDYPTATGGAGGFDEKDRDGPLARIGGPGFVTVASGHAAVLERLGAPSGVAAAGRYFMRRFEILRDVVDLRDQFRTRAEVPALTRDGIEVKIKDVQVSFRVRTGNRLRSSAEVYPFSTAAVGRIVYDRVVGKGGPSQWTDAVPGAVARQIREYIARHTLDQLIQPQAGDIRDHIRATFENVAGR
ncbi:MAG: hypothetical protein HY784_00400, partial [Chloroflexi bacterium]|nr:hypothetical protein [Chloroflexota bacterium]